MNRKIEKLVNNTWVEISSLDQVYIGDTFRMFEPTGEPVICPSNKTSWVAIEPCFITEQGVEGIRCI